LIETFRNSSDECGPAPAQAQPDASREFAPGLAAMPLS
jgi:hypothetical protein